MGTKSISNFGVVKMGLKFYDNPIFSVFNTTEPKYSNKEKFTAQIQFVGGALFSPGDGYIYHVFTSPGTLQSITNQTRIVDYIAIGGGGGGGAGSDGGGGGAGGYTTGTVSASGSIPIVIGAGGAAAPGPAAPGSIGNNTTVGFGTTTITAGYGGLGGSIGDTTVNASAPLGSGGGRDGVAGGTGGPQGFPAGIDPINAGGGGGAGGAGSGVDGGVGVQLAAPYRNIPGIGFPGPGGGSYWFAGGGGGGDGGVGGGAGGPYAGAKGDGDALSPRNSEANSGSGGSGDGGPGQQGAGGSGIVIIRYVP